MSIRGRITLECDRKDCHGELVLDAPEDFTIGPGKRGLDIGVFAYGWVEYEGDLICAQCVEAAEERAERDAEQESWRGYTDDEKARI